MVVEEPSPLLLKSFLCEERIKLNFCWGWVLSKGNFKAGIFGFMFLLFWISLLFKLFILIFLFNTMLFILLLLLFWFFPSLIILEEKLFKSPICLLLLELLLLLL